jgi:hypothetical protein
LAYVASLEERLRAYEHNGVQANIQLQKLAKKLDTDNRKLRRVLYDSCGLNDVDIDHLEVDVLVEEIKSRLGGGGVGGAGGGGQMQEIPAAVNRGMPSRSSSFSGGVIMTDPAHYTPSTPFPACCYPSAPLSDVRSQKPPSPPPNKEDKIPVNALLLTLAPQTAPSCGDGLSSSGKRFCGLLQLLASEANAKDCCSASAVPCRVSYDLLKSLIDEQDALGMENAAFQLKDGVLKGDDGPCVDAKVLTQVLERITNKEDNKGSMRMMMTVDA